MYRNIVYVTLQFQPFEKREKKFVRVAIKWNVFFFVNMLSFSYPLPALVMADCNYNKILKKISTL